MAWTLFPDVPMTSLTHCILKSHVQATMPMQIPIWNLMTYALCFVVRHMTMDWFYVDHSVILKSDCKLVVFRQCNTLVMFCDDDPASPMYFYSWSSHSSLWSSLSTTIFTYGLPYDPCGPPCSIYCLSLVFPIACIVLPTDPCGLPYAIHYLLMVFPIILVLLPVQFIVYHWSSLCSTLFTCGPPCSIYCLLVIFPTAFTVLPADPCGLPYAIHYLFMVFPMALMVLPG